MKVLAERYLRKDDQGKTVETPKEMFMRVAQNIAAIDLLYDLNADATRTTNEFYQLMESRDFLPNSPTLMNAGLPRGQLSACFVLPVQDSMEEIFDALKAMALIQKTGGGTGFCFSKLRRKGDLVGSTMGRASGPVSFMKVFDAGTDVVKGGGRRRGANMGILDVTHPDILEFITAKQREGFLSNFDISVRVSDEFMDAVEKDEEYDLVNPRTGAVGKLRARDVLSLMAMMAWKTGEPGIIFLDEINRHNPTPEVGPMVGTNPCGEQPLLPYESCNLGSINLAKMVKNGCVEWGKLRRTVHSAIHFLDNVIDANEYPSEKIEQITKGNRKVGLGVMGWAEMLIQLGLPYDSEAALEVAKDVMKHVSEEARTASVELARQRGSFPNFNSSIWKGKGYRELRNATVTTIAPTGSISIIAGCSSGIEPLFAVSFSRRILNGMIPQGVNPLFVKMAEEGGFYSEDLVMRIAKAGTIQSFDQIPQGIRRLFVTAHDILPEWHVRMQATFQRYCDNAVSKTVNLPSNATVEDVIRIFRLAHRLKCKGITIYRYGSREKQVLTLGSEYSGSCPRETAPSKFMFPMRCRCDD